MQKEVPKRMSDRVKKEISFLFSGKAESKLAIRWVACVGSTYSSLWTSDLQTVANA